jgi:hypothetical protein
MLQPELPLNVQLNHLAMPGSYCGKEAYDHPIMKLVDISREDDPRRIGYDE